MIIFDLEYFKQCSGKPKKKHQRASTTLDYLPQPATPTTLSSRPSFAQHAYMAWVLQVGLAIESFLNILGASTFLLFPDWCLSFAISTQAGKVPASTATLWQTYAMLVLALTYPLLGCIPNTPGVFYKRRIIFETLAAGEIGLIGLLL